MKDASSTQFLKFWHAIPVLTTGKPSFIPCPLQILLKVLPMSAASSGARTLFRLWERCIPSDAGRPGVTYTNPRSKSSKFFQLHQTWSHVLVWSVCLFLVLFFLATRMTEKNTTCAPDPSTYHPRWWFSTELFYFLKKKLNYFEFSFLQIASHLLNKGSFWLIFLWDLQTSFVKSSILYWLNDSY